MPRELAPSLKMLSATEKGPSESDAFVDPVHKTLGREVSPVLPATDTELELERPRYTPLAMFANDHVDASRIEVLDNRPVSAKRSSRS